MKKSISLLLFYFLMLTSAFSRNIGWDVRSMYDKQIFPSSAWAVAQHSNEYLNNENCFGDGTGQIFVILTNLKKGDQIKINVNSDEIIEESNLEFEMADSKVAFAGIPQLFYKWSVLEKWRQPKPVTFTFEVFLNNQSQGKKKINFIVRSINDCLFLAANEDSLVMDLNSSYAVYANENHPLITDTILPSILQQGIIENVSGYQSGVDEVFRQIYAVWNYFNANKFHYSSISSVTKNDNNLPITQSQYVRTFGEIYKTKSANCVEGSILFSAILLRMGLNPYLVTTPNHCYLGVSLDGGNENLIYLETTLLGADLSKADTAIQRICKTIEVSNNDIYFRLGKTQKTYNNLVWALITGSNKWENDKDLYKPEYKNFAESISDFETLLTTMKNLNYQRIDIAKLRKDGLLPLNL